jgi:preprotein translocase subunit SecG
MAATKLLAGEDLMGGARRSGASAREAQCLPILRSAQLTTGHFNRGELLAANPCHNQLNGKGAKKTMKKMFTVVSSLALVTVLALSALAQDTAKQGEKAKQPAKKAAAAPKSDADIQKCIQDKIAASASLKGLGLSATVSNGEATITGMAKSGGSKGAATKIAKNCGAKKVTNNITVEAAAKPAAKKPETKKP